MCNPTVTLVLWKGVSQLLRPGTSPIFVGEGRGDPGVFLLDNMYLMDGLYGLVEGGTRDMSVKGHAGEG